MDVELERLVNVLCADLPWLVDLAVRDLAPALHTVVAPPPPAALAPGHPVYALRALRPLTTTAAVAAAVQRLRSTSRGGRARHGWAGAALVEVVAATENLERGRLTEVRFSLLRAIREAGAIEGAQRAAGYASDAAHTARVLGAVWTAAGAALNGGATFALAVLVAELGESRARSGPTPTIWAPRGDAA